MQVCPKCGKPISDNKYERHLRRCGKSHKHQSRPLSPPSATPSFYWGRYESSYDPKHYRKTKTRHDTWQYGLVVIAVLVVAGLLIRFLL